MAVSHNDNDAFATLVERFNDARMLFDRAFASTDEGDALLRAARETLPAVEVRAAEEVVNGAYDVQFRAMEACDVAAQAVMRQPATTYADISIKLAVMRSWVKPEWFRNDRTLCELNDVLVRNFLIEVISLIPKGEASP